MQACVRLRRDDGEEFEVGHGAVIGRLFRADVPIPDPRVSEAHALVSLRSDGFRLLALRGRFAVDGKVTTDVQLEPGLQVRVTDDVTLTCDAVELPDRVLAVEAAGLPATPLHGVTALVAHPRPDVRAGYRREAAAHLLVDGDGAVLHREGGEVQALARGATWQVDGVSFTLTSVPVAQAGSPRTHQEGRVESPLTLVARYDAVHVQRARRETLVVSGVAARLISELVLMGGTAPWQVLAGEVWPDAEADRLRHRLDVSLFRLRKRLKEARVRSDLVRLDGCGSVELVLGPQDAVVDET